MHPNLPCSPSIMEEQRNLAESNNAHAAESYMMSELLLRDHLQKSQGEETDPMFTIEVMQRVLQTTPAPSRLTRLLTITPIVGIVTLVFTIGFVAGSMTGGIPSPHEALQWITTDVWTSPYLVWGAIGVSLLGIGVWQMETS